MRLIDANSAKSSILVVADCITIDSDWLNGYKTGLIAATEAIDEIPTVEAEPVKHGRWEYLQDDEWRCSNCHAIVNTGGQWAPMTDEFCRNCGAKMDGGPDDAEADR